MYVHTYIMLVKIGKVEFILISFFNNFDNIGIIFDNVEKRSFLIMSTICFLFMSTICRSANFALCKLTFDSNTRFESV
jgi:hypothetical protein